MTTLTRPRPRPAPQTGPAVWVAGDLTAADWMVPVGTEEAAELEAALTAAEAAAPPPPLTRLAPILADVATRLDTGRGFCLLRGLPFDRHGAAAADAALLTLGEHLGKPLNGQGSPVTRLTGRPEEGGGARAATPRFHIEACDAIALLCLANAPDAPPHGLVSAGAVHNEVMRRDRTALAELYEPAPLLEDGELTPRAVFTVTGGAFAARYTRLAVEEAATTPQPGAAPLSAGLRPAFDLLDAVCAEPALMLKLEPRPGDLLLFNPHLVWKLRSLAETTPDAPAAPQEFRRLRIAMAHSRRTVAEPG
ncbi:TauD/TfdA family dioxygenase [Roseomonas sp. HJA6]|uniref:TauD/TfdA family dioxygenase n=1 Tax=Roseomonas alba TaxID=2846776 RepID=A0ABS7A8R5_9PROT|nr:TauD/TfdA family dioxygenase [Neoroseomonas alba]MBW6398696.1 TauD/TfdA family dioxygenase [Neoroseomonas alba]